MDAATRQILTPALVRFPPPGASTAYATHSSPPSSAVIINALKAEAYDTVHGRVDYARLRASPTYAEYCRCARRLQSFDPVTLGSREERLAFWINLYNALIVDAVIQFEVKRSVNEAPGFFWRAAYNIGGQRYCAFDIEYGILRANAPHPAIPGAHFGASDPRRHSLQRLDPRIHFALVCAARSCPPIAVYDATRIDDQLEIAARTFINNGGAEIDRASGEVRRCGRAQNPQQRLELLAAVVAHVQMFLDERHEPGGVLAAQNGLGKLVEQTVNIVASVFHLVRHLDLPGHFENGLGRKRHRPSAVAGPYPTFNRLKPMKHTRRRFPSYRRAWDCISYPRSKAASRSPAVSPSRASRRFNRRRASCNSL
ncbi:MAG: DUF547 domain-containing protein [Chloroflexi bacterium]|nr:DUF547 domain-containing protein [Chloroflexota bacterium]